MKFFTMNLLVCFIAVLALSCSSTGQAPGPYHELAFSVDSTKLGIETTVGNVSLKVPIGWNAADFKKLARVQAAAKMDTSAYAFTPVAIYGGDSSNTVLLLMTFNHSPKTKGDFTDWAKTYLETARKEKPELNLQEDWLILGGVQALQIKATDSVRVQFKYLLNETPAVGATYVVPNNKWEFEGKAVESSLGTIKKKT